MSLVRLSELRAQQGALRTVGALNRWISLLTVPTGVNADGSPAAPSTFGSMWAAISPLSGSELYKAQQIAQDASHLVEIAYQPGVLESMQVQEGTRVFQIQFIQDPNEKKERLYLYCVERGQSA